MSGFELKTDIKILFLYSLKDRGPVSFIEEIISAGLSKRLSAVVMMRAIKAALMILLNFLNFLGKVIITTITIVP